MGWTKPLGFKKKEKEKKFDIRWRAMNRSFLDPAFQVAAFQLTRHNIYMTATSVYKPNSIHLPKIWKKWQNLEE